MAPVGSSPEGYALEFYIRPSDGLFGVQLWNGTASVTYQDVKATFIGTNSWRYICFTNNGTNTSIYNNGIILGSSSQLLNLSGRSIGYLIGGRNNGATYFNGSIDDVRIYNRSLSATEISALYVASEHYNNESALAGNTNWTFTLNNLTAGTKYWNVWAADRTNTYGSWQEDSWLILSLCNIRGYVKDGVGNVLNGAVVFIVNQINKALQNTTTDSNGFYNINASSSANYTAVAYYNNSLIGQAKPFITC